MAPSPDIFEIIWDSDSHTVICQGEWTCFTLDCFELSSQLAKIVTLSSNKPLIKNIKVKISRLDSYGALQLQALLNELNCPNSPQGLTSFQQALLKLITKSNPTTIVKKLPTTSWLYQLGLLTVTKLKELYLYLTFLGELGIDVIRIFKANFRWREMLSIIEKDGSNALGIVSLLSFMVGVVLTYQMGMQLQQYGANIFIIDLLGIAILREFGPLMSAILIAGRTGSAFTSQIGMMKINEELDALQTLGVPPMSILVTPRLLAMLISLPLLTLWADIFAVGGGMITAHHMLDVDYKDFLHRFSEVIPLSALIIGLSKAPIFAFLITTIGCFQGLRVQGGAESLGQNTTKSVVQSIFFIIVLDGIISILLSKFKL